MLTWKTAIGIAIRDDDLEFVCLKHGLSGTREGGRMTLSNFRQRRPVESAAAYREFLRGQGLSTANAIVALPRRDVLLRTLALPIEAAPNLAQAIGYQVDSLHPFEEGGVDFDYSVLRREATHLHVAVVMIEKGIAASCADWFAQAGIPVAGFTLNAATLYAGALAVAPAFAILRQGETAEILGVSNEAMIDREVLAAHLDRELELCRAEMRLPAEAEVRKIEQPDIAYAAAQAGIRKSPFTVNLLAPSKRVYQSPWAYAATYALAGVVVLLLVAMGMRGTIQDRLYLQHLNYEIRALEPQYKHALKLESREGLELTRIVTLRGLRNRTGARMQTLTELTRVLPPTTWISDLDLTDDGLTMTGAADTASTLLAALNTSSYFRNPEFISAITKNNEGKEQFRIHVQLSPMAQEGRP